RSDRTQTTDADGQGFFHGRDNADRCGDASRAIASASCTASCTAACTLCRRCCRLLPGGRFVCRPLIGAVLPIVIASTGKHEDNNQEQQFTGLSISACGSRHGCDNASYS